MKELFWLAMRNVLHRRVRSWLTVIGILIGTAAVVGLISIGQGLERSITHQVERIMGYNTLLITPRGPGFGAKLQLDLPRLRAVEGVEGVVAVRAETAYVESQVRAGFLPVVGYDPLMREFVAQLAWEIESGEGLTAPGQVVLGAGVAEQLEARVGDTLFIEDRPFRVVGILAPTPRQRSLARGVPLADSLFVLYSDLVALFPGPDVADYAIVKLSPQAEVGEVQARLERVLVETGTLDAEVIGFQEITDRIRSVLGGVQAFLAGIAGISLLVGGIGVMNTMYTAVLERTREIGVMKAVGAKGWQVMLLFLYEAGLMGLGGGLLGLGVGLGLAQGAAAVVGRVFQLEGGLSAAASPGLIFGALVFSFLVGAISGLLPAWRAARLPPVEALRYE